MQQDSRDKADLLNYRRDVFSQFGEDGILAEIFARIGTDSRYAVELGALNGVHHSNTRRLILEDGWSAVLIEGDQTYYEQLAATYADTPRVTPVHAFVDFDAHSLDHILATTPIPESFDLLSLDIDGNEYHLWESMTRYAPRVAVIEFNPTIPNDVSFVQPRDMSVQQGSSLRALTELAEKKGYTLVAVTVVNAFFVRTDLLPSLGLPARSIDELYTNTEYQTRLFQLYDGTLVLDGYQKLLWRSGMPIDSEKIQVLPKSRRTYVAGIRSHPFLRTLTYWYRKMPFYAALQKVRSWL